MSNWHTDSSGGGATVAVANTIREEEICLTQDTYIIRGDTLGELYSQIHKDNDRKSGQDDLYR